jgi:hypothetical protein
MLSHLIGRIAGHPVGGRFDGSVGAVDGSATARVVLHPAQQGIVLNPRNYQEVSIEYSAAESIHRNTTGTSINFISYEYFFRSLRNVGIQSRIRTRMKTVCIRHI